MPKSKKGWKRIMWFAQFLKHPETGDELINRDIINEVLSRRSIDKWAYILHDKDVYTAVEIKSKSKRMYDDWHKKFRESESYYNANQDTSCAEYKNVMDYMQAVYGYNVKFWKMPISEFTTKLEQAGLIPKAGDPKNAHYHVAIKFKQAVDPAVVAKWFNIPVNMLAFPCGGERAFLDCVEYLTHEKANGKQRYPDDEVCASFDWRAELNDRNEQKQKYGKILTSKEQMQYDVMYNGKSLKQCAMEDKLLYMQNFDRLKKMRLDYISRQPLPTLRINYYLYGPGGIGKGAMSRAIARALYPDIQNDEEIYYEAGAHGVLFDSYDGQPVIIWHDMRAIDFLSCLGGRGNVFNVLDPYPSGQMQNIKYGKVRLANTVNIINGIQDYNVFLADLAGEYIAKNGDIIKSEDKSQSYRRIPFVISIRDKDFDLLINRGFFRGTREYTEYESIGRINGNIGDIDAACIGQPDLRRQLESKALRCVVDKYHNLAKVKNKQQDKAVLLDKYAHVGDIIKCEIDDSFVPIDSTQIVWVCQVKCVSFFIFFGGHIDHRFTIPFYGVKYHWQ